MNREQWNQVEELYHAALEQPAAQRAAFLKSACADEALRREVESLLASEREDDTVLDHPAWERQLSPGERIGPYEVLSRIGAGGMGEVWKARDTRLGRDVALKVTTIRFSDRFKREARAIAALNHPHICTLFDVGSDCLVMEYLEGNPVQGPLPLDQVLQLGAQIADALSAAHRKGIIHRDLKPANILLTGRAGHWEVKLLDFGLAKIDRAITEDTAATASLTESREGQVLGTLQYMSPEQLQGKEVDARSDIFSLGCVLYELLTGRRAFEGKDAASITASILKEEPQPLTASLASGAFARLVSKCLAKDPDDRWQSASDLRDELLWIASGGAQAVPMPSVSAARRSWRWAAAGGIGMVFLLMVGLVVFDVFRPKAPPIDAIRSSLLAPEGHFFERGDFAVSPDGKRLAFSAAAADGSDRLWIRTFAAAQAEEFNGTEGAIHPFWSPDSRRIGFFAGGKLKVLDVSSGAVRIVCDAPSSHSGGAWNRRGTIVFAPLIAGPLYRVAETGGTPVPVTGSPKENGQNHCWPFFLPDGVHFLYTVDRHVLGGRQRNGLYVGSVEGGESKLITGEVRSNAVYMAGYLLYGGNRGLRAQPFDADHLQVKGRPISLAEQELQEDSAFSHSEFSVSETGVLVFQSIADLFLQLTWFDRTGKELGTIAGSSYWEPRLSRDGRVLAVASDDGHNGKYFVRVLDLVRGTSARLTDGGAEGSPAWSADGKLITYESAAGEMSSVREAAMDGSAPQRELFQAKGNVMHLDWSVSGQLIYADFFEGLPVLQLYTRAGGETTRLMLGAEPRFSPDGKWLAYAESGGGAVFVQPVTGPGGRINLSTGDGAQPVWSRNGREVFYIAPDRKLMVVEFDAARGSAGAPRVLFQTRIVASNYVGTQYDVGPDGRFLINSVPANYSSALTVVTDWTAQLRR